MKTCFILGFGSGQASFDHQNPTRNPTLTRPSRAAEHNGLSVKLSTTGDLVRVAKTGPSGWQYKHHETLPSMVHRTWTEGECGGRWSVHQGKKYLTVYEMPHVSAFRRKFYALEGCWTYDYICRSQFMMMTLFVTILVQTLERSLLLHLMGMVLSRPKEYSESQIFKQDMSCWCLLCAGEQSIGLTQWGRWDPFIIKLILGAVSAFRAEQLPGRATMRLVKRCMTKWRFLQ